MPNDPILHLLGLARKAGRLEIGEEPVGAVCRARQARLVLLASDAAANTNRRAAHFGEAGNVLWLELPYPKRSWASTWAGAPAPCWPYRRGLCRGGDRKLAARDPERYGPAAQQLRQKADRVLQRQKEKRQHEKNLQNGKKKPWAVPNPPRRKGSAAPQRAVQRPKRSPPARRKHVLPGRTPARRILDPAQAAASCPEHSGTNPKKRGGSRI